MDFYGNWKERFLNLDVARFGHVEGIRGMDRRIVPVERHMKVLGPACTVRIPGMSNAMLYYAIEHAPSGSVLVVDRGGEDIHACTGDGVASYAKLHGICGIVIDGPATDGLGIEELGFPVFSRGLSPVTTEILTDKTAGWNVPVSCGGCAVNPGDIIMGDCNGVVVLPADQAGELLAAAEEKERTVQERNGAIQSGEKKMSDFFEAIRDGAFRGTRR